MTEDTGPASGTRIRRYRVRSGVAGAFSRLNMSAVQIGLVKDYGTFTDLIERVYLGERMGSARRIHWYVNPSRRRYMPVSDDEGASLMGEALEKVLYSRCTLQLAGKKVTLIEFDVPLEAFCCIELDVPIGAEVEPPDWAVEDVTHDLSMLPEQIAVNHFRERRGQDDDGLADLLKGDS